MAKYDSSEIGYQLHIGGDYHNTLDVYGFSKMLKDPSYCYKFYWLEAIVKLIAENKTSATYGEIIDEMIANRDIKTQTIEFSKFIGINSCTFYRHYTSVPHAISHRDQVFFARRMPKGRVYPRRFHRLPQQSQCSSGLLSSKASA